MEYQKNCDCDITKSCHFRTIFPKFGCLSVLFPSISESNTVAALDKSGHKEQPGHFHEKKRSALVRLIEMRDARLSRSNNPQKRLQRRNELVETFVSINFYTPFLLPDKNAQFRAPSTSWHKFDFAWHLLLHFISLRAFAGYMSFDSFYRI